jgi:hypothetical protein
MFDLVQSLIGNFDKVCGVLGKFRIELGYATTDRHIKILYFVLKSLTGHFFPDSLSNIDSPLNLCFRQHQKNSSPPYLASTSLERQKFFFVDAKPRRISSPF